MRIRALAFTGLALLACHDEPVVTRPDLLLITLDTLRADRLGAYGAPGETSPTLDALALRGVVFERAIAASSRTAPSHASMFTSRWVSEHSIGYRNGATRLDDAPTLAGLLAEAGYETAAFVSNSMLRRRVGLDSGFGVYDDALPDSESNRPVFERIAAKTSARAVEWLRSPRSGPRFLWVQYNDAHGPYTPPDAYVRKPGALAPPAKWLPLLDIQRGVRGIPAYQAHGDERNPRLFHERYLGEIRYLDACLRELIDTFGAEAAAGSIIAVVADHGESLGEEDIWFSHGYATTPNLAHVPFLLVADGLPAGRVETPVHHVDLMPTLLELVGMAPPPGASGVALGPVLRGETQLPADRPLYVDVGSEVSVYRGDTFLRARFGDSLGDAEKGSRTAWRWSRASSWKRAEPTPELVELAEAYGRERVSLRLADEPSEEQEQRLRALGYLEPSTPDAEQDANGASAPAPTPPGAPAAEGPGSR